MSKYFWLMSAGMMALATPAYAQQADDDVSATQEAGSVDDQEISEIIVTATRRNEALSDVPIAVSAVSGETLENSGATDIRQLQQLSPSLQVSSTQSEGGASTARIRGVGTVGDNPGLESSVAVFIDGVYRSRNATALTELGQIDRIEVLRGPQGTLFGRNASAGIISVITAKPRFEQEVTGQLSYGNYDFFRGELGATGPVAEGLAYRVDGIYMRRDGFLTDVNSGRDVNDRNRYLIRGQLLYQPTDSLSVRLIGDYTERDEECCAAVFLTPFDTVNSGGTISRQPSSLLPLLQTLGANIQTGDPYDRLVSITPGRRYRQDVNDFGLSGEVVYDFGGAELTSITAYRDNRFVRGGDFDYNALDIIARPDNGNSRTEFGTFTQEVRLQGESMGGRLDWLVGGYFANENATVRDNLGYGADYQRYANCLLATGLSQQLSAAFGTSINLVSPAASGCFNAAVGGAVAANPAVPASTRQVVALLSGLAPGVPVQGFGALAAATGAPTATLNNQFVNDLFEQNSRNFALFTHNVFEVTDQFNITAGLRYTNERKTLDATLQDTNVLCGRIAGSATLNSLAQLPCVLPNAPGGFFQQEDARKKEDALSGTFVLSFKPIDPLLTYASYSRGYKAGGFNLDRTAMARQVIPGSSGPVAGPICGPTDPASRCANGAANLEGLRFEPEQVDAFELGMKYNGPGIDVNVAAFHQTFDDFQLNTFNGVNFIVENINACEDDLGGADTDNNPNNGACTGKVKGGVVSRGVELETFFRPIRNLGLNLGATIVDTKYRDNLVGTGGRPLTNALFQLPGRRLSNSSLWTATGSLTYQPPIPGTSLTGLFYVDGRYQSEFNTGSDLDLEKLQDDYFVMNARVGVRGGNGMWGLELWAQNLLNTDYMQVAFDAFIQGSGTQRGVEQGFYPRSTQLYGAFLADPRTYGITGRFRF
ncbi:MAG TPA: TonB-dependent receptor [Allosphingosinicella sp.]|nr:TonB-dependent receptor [Allosphingosinicella sp.]